MKTIIQQRGNQHPLTQRLGRAATCVTLGLVSLFAPAAHGQTNNNGCFAAPAGLVGWWRAEGDATDFTGANPGAFPFGSAFTAGVGGQAFDFDGSSRRVSIPDSPALQLTNAMTLEAWVYPRAYGGFITFRGDNRGGLDNWTLDTYDSGFVKFSLHDPTNNAVSLRAPLALNQWQHVAATWSRASGDLKIYINGTLSAQTNSSLVPIGALDSSYEPAIGIGNHGGTFHQFPFNGLIDELGIYNRALNSNEIAGIVTAGSAGKCTSSTPPVSSRWLLSVDFGADLNGNDKAGFAALGQTTNDFWNFYSRDDGAGGWRTFGVLSSLKTVGGTITSAGLTVANAPGAWGNGSPDKMYDDYIYPFDSGNVTVTVTNLPAGQYDVLAYANDGNFELAVGSYGYGTRTSLDVAPTNAPAWTAGVQYARYTNVSVTAGLPLVLTVRPGIYGYAIISGLQLSATLTTNTLPGTNPPAGDCVALPGGAISWWRGEGSTLDNIRTNHGSVVGGVTTVPGKVGNGFGFDGTSYLVVPHHPSLNNSNALTIELWYKSTQNTNSDYGLIDKRVGFTGANFGINVIAGAGLGAYYDDLGVQDGDDLGSSFETSRYNPIPAPGVFHHLAATYVQFSNNLVRVQTYLNGQNVRTRYIAGNLANTLNTSPVTIGATAQGAGEFFQGVIDEITLYNRVLSATEIQSIYAADSAGKCVNPEDSCFTPPAGLVSWWRAEGNAADSTSVNHGTLTGAASYTAGRIGQAFDFDGDRDGVSAGTATNLQLQDFSVEAWIKRRSDSVISFNGNGNGQLFTVGAGGGGSTFYLQADSRLALGKLQVSQVTSDAMVTDTNWHHVAVTKAGTVVTFFVDGVAHAAPAYNSSGEFTFNGPAYIGAWLNPSQLVDNTFYGAIDELAVYNRALTTNEIVALYNASGNGKCVPATTTSVITKHPQDTLVIVGGTAQFEVTATGIPAPSYQWYFQNNPLPGQTSAALILDNVLPDKQGTYSVLVSNPSGSLLSSNATLTVVTTQAVLLVDGNTPASYNDSLGTILDGTAPQFPIPFDQGGGDPTFFPSPEPNLAAATGILGDWLAAPQNLTTNWRYVDFVPETWALNTETAIIYKLEGGPHGIMNLLGDFDADNGIYVWVNGQYKFGARHPGLPSPTGQFEYTNVFLGHLSPGTNYIQILREDSGITAGSQIRLTGAAMSTNRQPPTIVQSPTNQTVAAGSSALFTVVAEGTPALSYQWRFEGANLAGQTSSTLSLLNVQPARAGNYSVLVSNAYGSVTSAVATLTVLTYPPAITSQPQDRTGYEGQSVSFTVGATGTATLRYQWSRNGTNLPNAILPTLTVPNLQSNLAGFYQVIVSNPYGTVTSRLAQLTLLPPPPCTPAPDGVIAWWPGQSNLWDVVGGFDATPYQTLLYTTGKVGATLNLGANQNYAIVRTGGGLNVNAGSGLTIEGWVRPNSLSGAAPIAEWSDGRSAVGAGLLLNSGGLGTIEATLTDTNLPKVTVTFRSAALAVTNGLWQHVALTYNKSNGLATIYVNGNVVAQTNAGILNPTTSGDVYLGYRAAGTYAGNRFNGTLDEITLYNRALTATEVQSIVAADFIGKCPPLPPACITPPADIVAWWRGESNTVDLVAGNDAIRIPTNYTTSLAYQTGQVGMAFRFNLQTSLSVPRSESMDVGTGGGMTVEGWIYPATLSPMPIVEWTDTNSFGANLWMSYSRGATVLEANLIDTGGGFHLIRSPINTIRGYSWQHVAVTYDKTTGLAALYSDGALVVSTNLGLFTPRTSTDLLIGYHPGNSSGQGGDGYPPYSSYRFNGAMDELAIYRRALTAAEIRNVARPRPGKCLELPPTISQHPQPQIAIAGGSAQFAVKAGGTAPFQYQWLFAGQPIGGATNANLSLSRLDFEDAGLYSVRISNLFGTATSRAAELTLLASNQCLPTPYGAVAFWRGESNIVDELGRHPAQWGTNTIPAYVTGTKEGGKVGTAFRFNGANHLQIPSDADLNVGAGSGFTIEGWIKPDSAFTSQPIWDWNDNRQNIGVGLMLSRTGPGSLEVTLTDTNASSSLERVITLTTPNYTIGSPTNSVAQWTHIALTFDKLARSVALHVNGRLVAERSVPLVFYYTQYYDYRFFSPATTGNLYFGWRPSGLYSGSRFRGAMDEMSVYYRALTPLELQAIYVVGSNGKCTPTPTCQSLALGAVSWWRGESNTLDSVDGNHGSPSPSPGGPGISYTNGIVGLGFKTASSRYVQIPASPSLNVGTSTGLTFETWFKLDSVNTAFALASWNLGSTQGVYIGTSPTRGAGYLEANLVDTAGISRAVSFFIHSTVVPGVQPWQHLAVTYDKPSGQAVLYLNGSPMVVTNLGRFTPRTTGALNLGFRPQTASGGGATLNGALDETVLYHRALSADEITASYRNTANRCLMPPYIVSHTGNLRVNSGSNAVFAVVANGSPLLRYQWGVDRSPVAPNALLPGQTNTSLTLTNVQAKDAGRYWVRVTNAFGLTAVSNLVLTVNFAPVADNQTVTTPEDTARSFTLSASDLNQDLLLYTVLTYPTNGTLSGTNANRIYTPKPNFFGADSFTFRAGDGLQNSATATVSIAVTPVNDPPSTSSQIATTDEDTPLPLTLGATDVEGDALTFQITPPAHGTLSGTAPDLVYTPHADYFGDDLFTFTVTDSSNAVSQLAAISITVRPVNDTPVARMELAPLDELPGITNLVSIAPVCCAATLRLDASQSTDVENEPLSYAWLIGTNVVSTEAVVTNRLAPGTYEITLIVSDDNTAAHQTRTVEIITATETVNYLIQLVEAGVNSRNLRSPLLNWLRETGKSFDHCHVEQGVHFLELFRDRVADRIKPTDPELAQSLMDTATAIIEAAPDCDPCQRLGRKDRKHVRDHDRDDRDGRNDRDRQDDRDNDQNDRNRSGDRNSNDQGQDDRESKSERAAPAAQSSQAELRPLTIEAGAERPAKSRE